MPDIQNVAKALAEEQRCAYCLELVKCVADLQSALKVATGQLALANDAAQFYNRKAADAVILRDAAEKRAEALQSEVDSLRGDRERLSALEELVCGTPGNVIINYDPELREGWQVIDSATGNRWIGIDLIAAIDAARSASAPENK